MNRDIFNTALRGSRGGAGLDQWSSKEIGWIVAAWTIGGVLFGTTNYFGSRLRGGPVRPPDEALIAALAYASAAVVVTLIALWVSRRFPLERRRWKVSFPAHLVISFFVVIGRANFMYLVYDALPSTPERSWIHVLSVMIPPYLEDYWLLVGVAHAIEYARRFRQRSIQSAQLEAQLTRAQLQVLKMQLNPHMLFNTLHAISALIHQDARAADRMVANLGSLLRASLESVGTQEVPLRDELGFLESYLAIEQSRLNQRLCVSIDVDEAVGDALVPHFLLQPLVENSIRHAIAPRDSPGRLEIAAHRVGGQLRLRVADNGSGVILGWSSTRGTGIGLANTRARLELLYGNRFSFSLKSEQGQGLAVTIEIPYRTQLQAESPYPGLQAV